MPLHDRTEHLKSIAVVVIGRNEGARLHRCLDSINTMNYPAELIDRIYVDSGSTDDSVKNAADLGFRTILLEGRTTAARARNAGWTVTDHPFILFLDGDTVLHADFVREALASLVDPEVAGVSGNRRESNCDASIYNAISDLYWFAKPGPKAYFGGDALVRLEALQKVDGYNGDLIAGEEPDMCRRMRGLGYTIQHLNIPMTLHDIDIRSGAQYWRRCVRSGYAYAEVSSMYAETTDPLWSKESNNNLIRGTFWSGSLLVCLLAFVVFRAWLPGVCFLVLLSLLAARTAWHVRSRTSKWSTRVAYGFASHLQHIPILVGQLKYRMAKRKNQMGNIIEYK